MTNQFVVRGKLTTPPIKLRTPNQASQAPTKNSIPQNLPQLNSDYLPSYLSAIVKVVFSQNPRENLHLWQSGFLPFVGYRRLNKKQW